MTVRKQMNQRRNFVGSSTDLPDGTRESGGNIRTPPTARLRLNQLTRLTICMPRISIDGNALVFEWLAGDRFLYSRRVTAVN